MSDTNQIHIKETDTRITEEGITYLWGRVKDWVRARVPNATDADAVKFLRGDNKWAAIETDSTITGNGTADSKFSIQDSLDSLYDTITAEMNAHAQFVSELPEEGDPSKIYYVGPKEGASPDKYDVYVWRADTSEFVMVDEATITVPVFSGSDAGLVPASTTETQAKYLTGNGQWSPALPSLGTDLVYDTDNVTIKVNTTGTATGQNAFVEGIGTEASGFASHAEGYGSKASEYFTHAEGNGTKATAWHAHAEGNETTASGQASHAEGYKTVSSGMYSHAEGDSTSSTGERSHAEGANTLAKGRYSHAEGNQNNAYGDWSHAEGQGNSAGKEDNSSGWWSHAEGNNTTATGNASHAEGSSTTASGPYSHAEGAQNTASGDWSHAEGLLTTASGTYAHTEGHMSKATTYRAHAEGWETEAGGNASHAEGYKSVVTESGLYAHAEGYNTKSDGQAAHAEGWETKATGVFTHAEGYKTVASSSSAHAEGSTTTASGLYAHAEGMGTTAESTASHAEGIGTLTNAVAQHVAGKYNAVDSEGVLIVGNGTDADNRSNAMVLKTSGDLYLTGDAYVQTNKKVLTTDDQSAVKDITLSEDATKITITKQDDTTFDFKGGEQANWTQTDSTKPDYIKNMPADLREAGALDIKFNDTQFSKAVTETDITFTVKSPAASGKFLRDDGTWAGVVIPEVNFDDTVSGSGTVEEKFSVKTMVGATEDADGTKGLVPAPSVPDSLLAGDGLWKNVEIIDKVYVDSMDWNPKAHIGTHWYNTVTISGLTFIAENLKEPVGDYRYPNGNANNVDEFGYLYSVNRIASSEAFNNLLAGGWRIPTIADWRTAGFPGSGISGTGARFIDTKYGGTNTTGLCIRPGGKSTNDSYSDFNMYGYMMVSKTSGSNTNGLMFELPTTGNTVRGCSYSESYDAYFTIRLCKNA